MSTQSQLEVDSSRVPPFGTAAANVSSQLIELAGPRAAVRYSSIHVVDEHELPAGAIEMATDMSTGEVCGLLVGELVGVDANGNALFGRPRRRVLWFAYGDADPEDALIERLFTGCQLH